MREEHTDAMKCSSTILVVSFGGTTSMARPATFPIKPLSSMGLLKVYLMMAWLSSKSITLITFESNFVKRGRQSLDCNVDGSLLDEVLFRGPSVAEDHISGEVHDMPHMGRWK